MNNGADSNLAAFIWWHTTYEKSLCIESLIVCIYYDMELISMMPLIKNDVFCLIYRNCIVAMHLF